MSGPVYLLSSLPYLDISIVLEENTRTQIDYIPSIEDFLSLCDKTLHPYDADIIRIAIRNPQESNHPFVQSIVEYFYAIRNAIAKKRYEAMGTGTYTDVLLYDRVPVSADAAFITEQASNAKHPLARELEIKKALWAYLDDCDARYHFCVENGIVYGYKLLLFHDMHHFQREAGDMQWKQLVGNLAEKAGFSRDAIGADDTVFDDTQMYNAG